MMILLSLEHVLMVFTQVALPAIRYDRTLNSF